MLQEVLKNVFFIKLAKPGCNVYLIKDKNILIDTSNPLNKKELVESLVELDVDYEDLTVINTHCHIDHIGNNGLFKEVVMHKLDAEAYESHSLEAYYFTPPEFKIKKKLKDGEVIKGLIIIHTPGHTKGSICLLDDKNKVLFSGDTIFANGIIGRFDLPGGSKEELFKSLKKLAELKLNKFRLLPGHGKLSDDAAQEIKKGLGRF